jgi:hypothetical protein
MAKILKLRPDALSDLAARIKAAHEKAKSGLAAAMDAGDLLVEAKERMDRGQWVPWLMDHCDISERTAQRYMRLARNRAIMLPKNDTVADLSINKANQEVTVPKKSVSAPRSTSSPAPAAASPAPPSPSVSEATVQAASAGEAVWREQIAAMSSAFVLTSLAEETGFDIPAMQREIREAAAERQRQQERITGLEEENERLREELVHKQPAEAAGPVCVDLTDQLLSLPLNEREVVLKNVANAPPPVSDARARQEWGRVICNVIEAFGSKLAGPKDDPYKWRKKARRLIYLPPGMDVGQPSNDPISADTTTADESALAPPKVVHPPIKSPQASSRPPAAAVPPPKIPTSVAGKRGDELGERRVAETDQWPPRAAPGSLLKPDKKTRAGGRDGSGFD